MFLQNDLGRGRNISGVFVVLSDKDFMWQAYIITGQNADVFFLGGGFHIEITVHLGDGSHAEITVHQPAWREAAGLPDVPPPR